MHKRNLHILFVILIVFSISTSAQKKLLVAGSGWPYVAILDKTSGEIEWSYKLENGTECNDTEMTRKGNILIGYKKGAKLISKNQKVIWNFKVEKGQELFTATELPNGNFFLAVCANPSRFITLDQNGQKIKEQNFNLNIPRVHGQFRQVFPTPDNTLLIPVMAKGEVIELSENNEIIKQINVGGNPFSVKLLDDGNWLVACGDAHKLVLVDPQKEKILKQIRDEDIPDYSLYFVAEPHKMKNGNIMFCNWNGHVKDKSQPKIIEIDAKNKVVWTLLHNINISNISTVNFLK